MPRERESLNVSLDRELVKWIDGEIALKRFSDRDQAIEYALKALRVSGAVGPFDRER